MSCETSGAGNILTLSDTAGSSESQSDEFGAFNWSEVEPGAVTIGMTSAEGDPEAAVFCGSSTVVDGETIEVFPERVQVTVGSIAIEVEAESDVYCDWFTMSGTRKSVV